MATIAGTFHDHRLTPAIASDSRASIAEPRPQGRATILSALVNGLAADHVIQGGGGDDLLSGGDGDDTLSGSLGNDSLHGGIGHDVERGSVGDDALFGDEGDDTLSGSIGDDTLQGGLGDDEIGGALGDDALSGDDGDDALSGGIGDDTLHGGGGGDEGQGDIGHDVLFGDDGDDTLSGDLGNDSLHGGLGEDDARGGLGADRLEGEDGGDTLAGDAGNDTLAGGDGSDTLNGGAGDDSIDGGTGIDSALFAGKIADYAISTVAGITTVTDLKPSSNGDDGTDTLTGVEQLHFADGTVTIPGGLSAIDLAALTPAQGFVIYGADAYDRSGLSVSSAGDVNGDGFDDVMVSAYGVDLADRTKSSLGETYVIYGTSAGFGASLDLAALTPAQGFVIRGVDAYDIAGRSASSAGDVNGDGFDDLVLGAPFADSKDNATNQAGEAYVIFGTDTGFGPGLDLATLTPSQGFVIYGTDVLDRAGWSVSSAGDVNGDGFDDVIVSAYGADSVANAKYNAGESYVIFGTDAGFGASLDLAALTPAQGFVIIGAEARDKSGFSVSSAGDVNGDGLDDLIIGALAADGAKAYAGQSYVIFGTEAGFGASIDLAALTPAQGFVVSGADADDASGVAVSSAGDMNGDGFDDLAIGAVRADAAGNAKEHAGESYVVFGTDAGFGANLDLAALTQAQGFVIYGADEFDVLGSSLSSAGDVNGDGYDDLIVGAFWGDAADNAKIDAGDSYVIFGTGSGFGASLDLAALAPTQGFVIHGADKYDQAGSSVSSAGDVNGDGFDDLIVGAPTADAAGNAKNLAGESYVIFGGDFTGGVVFAGTSGADALTGTAAAEVFVGGQGDDTLAGGGGADAFQGGAGDDSIAVGGALPLDLNGGSGIDTVGLDETGSTVDLSGLASSRFAEIEKLDLGGTHANTLVLDKQAVLDMVGSNGDAFADNTLLIKGDAADRVSLTDGGWTAGPGVLDPFGETGRFITCTNGAATLLVESEVRVQVPAPSGALDLATLTGAQGFIIHGAEAFDRSGFAVSTAGDVNGDGVDDVIVGALNGKGSAPFGAGESYVIFGTDAGFALDLDLVALTPDQGFVIRGAELNDLAGGSVGSAGDVNGDGFDDLLVGAVGGDAANNAKYSAGESYVVFGTDAGFGAGIDLATLTPTQGFVIYGADEFDFFSRPVRSAGDVNGDGFEDIVIGARFADGPGNTEDEAGESYVIFGTDSGFGAGIDVAALTPAQGFVIYGADAGDQLGVSVDSAGDVNGDGFDDLLLGAQGGDRADGTTSYAGESYVIFGTSAGFGASLDLATLTAAQGFVIYGVDGFDRSGMSVSSAGDVNGDGFDDLIIGADAGDAAGNARIDAGESYVVFGTDAGLGASIDLATLSPAQGFVIDGAGPGDLAGFSVSSAGDVNGDGFDDLLIGATGGDGAGNTRAQAGESYLIFGTDAGFGARVDLATLTPEQGIVIYGPDRENAIGRALSGAGDVNADGFDDLIIGVERADDSAGASYVVFGGNLTGDAALAGTSGADKHIGNIEQGDLTTTGDNAPKLSRLDVLGPSNDSNALSPEGDTGDRVDVGAGSTAGGTANIAGQTCPIYAAGAEALKVDTDILQAAA